MSIAAINPANHSPAQLREDLDLHPGPLSVAGAPSWTLHDPVRNRFFSLGEVELAMLQRWGSCTVNELVEQVNKETSLSITARHVIGLEHFLAMNQLLRISGQAGLNRLAEISTGLRHNPAWWLLHHYLFFRIPLLQPDRFLSRTLPSISFVFSRNFALLIIAIALLGIYLVTRQWDAFSGTFSYLFSMQGMLIYAIALSFGKALHELGHAYTAKRYGLKVPTMGVAFLVMWPVLYTDTSDAWKLTSKRQRMAIDVAGILAELALAAIATLAWSLLPEGAWKSAAFFLATASWTITLLINANPFMRWDGYYLLADYLAMQNLHERAFNLARWKLRERLFGLDLAPPEQLPPRLLWKVLLYAYLTWIYRLVLFLGIALVVYHFFFKLAGLILMAVEIAWFIARPVYREVKMWHRLRRYFTLNRHSFVTLSLLAGLILLLVIPWNRHITAPAMLGSIAQTTLYPPIAAQIETVNVTQGTRVETGEVLFTLNSPNLSHRLELAKRRIDHLRSQLGLQLSNKAMRDQRLVLEQKLAENIADHRGLQEQLRRLTVIAPFSGAVVDITEALTPGRWVRKTLPLARLVADNRLEVSAYLEEDDLSQITRGDGARFYPENLDEPVRALVIDDIDPTGIQELEEPYLASIHGGPIAVNQRQSRLIPNGSYYRVRLRLASKGPPLRQMSRGIIRIEGEPRTLLQQAWLAVGAVVIRESGF